jgi:Uncharacterised nucleotidyltransferase
MPADAQLAALAALHDLFERHGIDYWVFGGWAVDFHAGAVTRPHDDIDVAVRSDDGDRVQEVLTTAGWTHTQHEDYTTYALAGVHVEVAFADRGEWPESSFGADVAEVRGVCARVVSLPSLRVDKAQGRDDPRVAEKDRRDSRTLAEL